MKQQTRTFWVGLAAGAGFATLSATFALMNSENMLKSSFASALVRANLPTREVASNAKMSGSEAFWLSAVRQNGNGPMTMTKTISVGDKISMSIGGEPRTLEVATVKDFSPQTTEIDTSSGPSHLVLVTARDVNDAAARPIRFVMEIEAPNAPVVTSRGGRTL